jgi:hypothetical protein
MRGHQDDKVAWQPGRGGARPGATRVDAGPPAPPGSRSVGLVAAVLLAVAASVAAFLTDDVRYQRAAVVVAAAACVLAASVAGRGRADQRSAAGREEELRRRYEAELDREDAAHREYELELENHLRREAEDSMRGELTALRSELAELGLLRHEVARVARLGTDLPALSGLRADLASLSGLRDDLASLTSLREDLAALPELKADVGRLRTELAEQLNGEMLIERIVMRTQAIRTPAEQFPSDAPRTIDAATRTVHPTAAFPGVSGPAGAWEDERRPRGLTTGRPAAAGPPAQPDAGRSAQEPAGAPPTPREWLADRSLVEPDSLDDASLPPRRRRSDEPAGPGDELTQERPVAPAIDAEPGRPGPPRPSPHPRTAPQPITPAPAVGEETESAGHLRLAEILAQNGAQPPSGRRRRRYRDEADEADDVLARVLRKD